MLMIQHNTLKYGRMIQENEIRVCYVCYRPILLLLLTSQQKTAALGRRAIGLQ